MDAQVFSVPTGKMGVTTWSILQRYWGLKEKLGFPGGSDSEEFTCKVGDLRLIPGLGDPMEKGKATHSGILAWRIPWTEELGIQGAANSWTQLSNIHSLPTHGRREPAGWETLEDTKAPVGRAWGNIEERLPDFRAHPHPSPWLHLPFSHTEPVISSSWQYYN